MSKKQWGIVSMLVALVFLNSYGIARSVAQTTDCQTVPIVSADQLPEIQGTVADGQLWALFFAPLPLKANAQIKVVWRMTGTGDFSLIARHPDGTTIKPIWGPEAHGGSSWNRPGAEWGAGFVFPEAGCWTITATRGSSVGTLRVPVINYQYF